MNVWACTSVGTYDCMHLMLLLVLTGPFMHIRKRHPSGQWLVPLCWTSAPPASCSKSMSPSHSLPQVCACVKVVDSGFGEPSALCSPALGSTRPILGTHNHSSSSVGRMKSIPLSLCFFSATKPDSGTSVSLWCFYHYFPHNQIWMIWELLNSCFHKRTAFPGSSKFSHCQVETGSFSGEEQLGWWAGTPGGALIAPPAGPHEMALDSEAKLSSTSRALDHVLSVQCRAHCLAGPRMHPKPERLCINVQSWKVLFFSARDQYHELDWKLPWNWFVWETVEMGGIRGAGGACPRNETLLVLGASSLNSRL